MNVHFHFLKLLTLALLSPYLLFSQTNYPNITQNRPRISVPEGRFDIIKGLLNDSNQERIDCLFQQANAQWVHDLWFCNDDIKLCGNQNDWEWSWDDEWRTLNTLKMILLYYHISETSNDPLGIDKNLQKQRINYIAQQFIEYIDDFMSSYSNEEHNSDIRWELEKSFRFISRFGPILIDWGYNAINSNVNTRLGSLRNMLVNKLWEASYDFMKYFVYREFFDSNHWKNNYFAGGHALQNNMLNMKLVLSLYHSQELSAGKQDSLDIRYRFLYDNLKDEFIPIFKFYADDNNNGYFDENEGNFHWGGAYNYVARLWFLEYFDLISYATNKNLYTENQWTSSLCNQHFYLIKPDDSTLHLGDDIKDLSNKSYNAWIISLFNRFGNPKIKWLMKEYENHNISGTPTRIEEIILRDFSIPSSYPTSNPAHLTWFSKKTGTHIYKSSFENDATMFTFVNAPTNKNNHLHLDNNSFQIFKSGPLFIDSGAYDYYGSNHYLNYYTRTIAHNTVTIFNPYEQFLYGYDSEVLSNDGGQTIKESLLNYTDIINDYDYESSWLSYINNFDFTYIKSDATSSYSNNKLNSYIRKILYLKSTDRMIVLDYVDQPDLSNQFVVKWNAHFKNKPIVYNGSGGIASPTSIIGNNVLRYDNYEKDFYVSNANLLGGIDPTPSPSGNAKIKTLLPVQPEAKIIGGSGYEYYVDGINYPPTEDIRSEGARWRLEIRQTRNLSSPKSIRFLNTIEIGDNNSVADNESELVSTINSSIVVNWDNNLFFFSKSFSGSSNTSHITDISSLAQGSYKIYAFDLIPNILYDVKKGSNTIASIQTDNNGFLETNYLYINGSDLKIVPRGILAEKSQNNKLKVFPNEINKGETLNIILDKSLKKGSNGIYIYNISGLLMISDIFDGNVYTLADLNLETGVYLIKVINGKKILEAKLIVN